MKNFFYKKIPYLLFLIYFIPAFFTLSNYNVNWDEAEHFRRGQAILRYFLTRETNYNNLSRYDEFVKLLQNQNRPPRDFSPRYSVYQSKVLDGSHYLFRDNGGHPPLGDILAAFFNYIFYQKLDILGDIEAYHLLIVVSAGVLVFFISRWVYKEYGFFAALIATLSLSLYPLFFAESHVNIKDPLQTTFFALTIYTFYLGIIKEKKLLVFLSSIFFGMTFATKFNVLFLPFILFPWLLVYYGRKLLNLKKFFLLFLLLPFIIFTIFFISWPYLWFDFPERIMVIFSYYKGMGTAQSFTQPADFYFNGYNTYPWQTILFTTPLVILFFSFFGIVYVFVRGKTEKNKTSFLILFWFLIPIIRVTMPGTSIYGGVRQIMEYIPAMAILSGIGADYLVRTIHGLFVKTNQYQDQKSKIKNQKSNLKVKVFNFKLGFAFCTLRFALKRVVLTKKLLQLLIIFSFLPIALKLISIHPNENVYFNPMIGGLKGAKEKNYPYWGLTLGSSYKQGVEWLNKNAEKNANVALVLGTGENIPRILFREDLVFYNGAWSGTQRKGEYLIEVIFNGWIREWIHAGEYVDKVLIPVYESKVDDVAILRVWKNDSKHTYPRFLTETQINDQDINWRQDKDILFIKTKDILELMSISVGVKNKECFDFKNGQVSLSLDDKNWKLEQEPIRSMYRIEDKLIYPLVAKKARYIIMELGQTSCPFNIEKVGISYIK